jgi:hypothetical protein
MKEKITDFAWMGGGGWKIKTKAKKARDSFNLFPPSDWLFQVLSKGEWNKLGSLLLICIFHAVCVLIGGVFARGLYKHYTTKKDSDFPVPGRDVTNQTLPAGRE